MEEAQQTPGATLVGFVAVLKAAAVFGGRPAALAPPQSCFGGDVGGDVVAELEGIREGEGGPFEEGVGG